MSVRNARLFGPAHLPLSMALNHIALPVGKSTTIAMLAALTFPDRRQTTHYCHHDRSSPDLYPSLNLPSLHSMQQKSVAPRSTRHRTPSTYAVSSILGMTETLKTQSTREGEETVFRARSSGCSHFAMQWLGRCMARVPLHTPHESNPKAFRVSYLYSISPCQ